MPDQLNEVPLTVETPDGALLPEASIDVPGWMVPAAMAVARSVRRALAANTAPSTFNRPVPCCSRLAPGRGWAEACRMALTSGGVSPGLACSSRATAPDTAGAAMDVPLSNICVSLRLAVMPNGVTSDEANKRPMRFQVSPLDAVAAAPTILLPGATRSGLSRLSTRRTPAASV